MFSLNNSTQVEDFVIANLIPMTLIFGADRIREVAFKYGKHSRVIWYRVWMLDPRAVQQGANSIQGDMPDPRRSRS